MRPGDAQPLADADRQQLAAGDRLEDAGAARLLLEQPMQRRLGHGGAVIRQHGEDRLVPAATAHGVAQLRRKRPAARDGDAIGSRVIAQDDEKIALGQSRRLGEKRRRDLGLVGGQRDGDVARQLAGLLQALGEQAPHQILAVIAQRAERFLGEAARLDRDHPRQ